MLQCTSLMRADHIGTARDRERCLGGGGGNGWGEEGCSRKWDSERDTPTKLPLKKEKERRRKREKRTVSEREKEHDRERERERERKAEKRERKRERKAKERERERADRQTWHFLVGVMALRKANEMNRCTVCSKSFSTCLLASRQIAAAGGCWRREGAHQLSGKKWRKRERPQRVRLLVSTEEIPVKSLKWFQAQKKNKKNEKKMKRKSKLQTSLFEPSEQNDPRVDRPATLFNHASVLC